MDADPRSRPGDAGRRFRGALRGLLLIAAVTFAAAPAAADQYDNDVAALRAAGFDPAPYQAAADAGDPDALYRLAIIEEESKFDFTSSFVLFDRAAAMGHAGAQYWLGRDQVRSAGDLASARLLLHAAAESGHPDAAALLTEIGGAAAPQAAAPAAPPVVIAQAAPAPAVQPAPAALPAGCLAPGSVNDRDVTRNASTITSAGLCVRQDSATDGNLTWTFTIVENTAVPGGPVWYLPHDDENSAFDAALAMVRQRGGKLIGVEAGESRSFRGQDPNRNFGRTAAVAATCRDQRAAAPNYTDYVMSQIRNAPVAYLALHSNDNGYNGDGRGGAGTISVYRKSSVLRGFPAPNPANDGFADGDSVVLFAGTQTFENSPSAQRTRTMVNDAGMHAIYERVTMSGNDCSLSNYVVLNFNDKPYFNVEVQHGKTDTQIAMVDTLLPMIGFGGSVAAAPVAVAVEIPRPRPEPETIEVVTATTDVGGGTPVGPDAAVTIDASGAITVTDAPDQGSASTDDLPPVVAVTGGGPGGPDDPGAGSLIGEDGISAILPGLLEEGSADDSLPPAAPDPDQFVQTDPQPVAPAGEAAQAEQPIALLTDTRLQLGLLGGLALILLGLLVMSPMRRRKRRDFAR